MIRKDIIAPHFGHRGLLIRSTNIAYLPLERLTVFACRGARIIWNCFAQIVCSEGDGCMRSDHECSYSNIKTARRGRLATNPSFARGDGSSVAPCYTFGKPANRWLSLSQSPQNRSGFPIDLPHNLR